MVLTALIDGDLVVHRICSAVQRELQSDDGWVYWWSDPEEVMNLMDSFEVNLAKETGEDWATYTWLFSASTNFRKVLEPAYKANRSGPKPLALSVVRETWAGQEFVPPNLEADDTMALYSIDKSWGSSVIVTADKDLLQVPGRHYNPYSPGAEIITITPEEGTYNFLTQVLTGDPTDNYPGCPGVGKVTAAKLLDKDFSWGTVVDAYGKKGLTEQDAIHQARLAYILQREGDYDWETGEVRLWTPEVYFG